MRRFQENLGESQSFVSNMDPRDESKVVRLGTKCRCPLNQLTGLPYPPTQLTGLPYPPTQLTGLPYPLTQLTGLPYPLSQLTGLSQIKIDFLGRI